MNSFRLKETTYPIRDSIPILIKEEAETNFNSDEIENLNLIRFC